MSTLRAPPPARLPNPKPTTIKPKDSRYERGTTGGQVTGRKSRGKPVKHDKRRYKRRNRIEIMFGRLKDWRRVATRYDRCPKVFLSAIALAATVMFWL
ncbi:transposase [Gemmobacter sp.]|uniref:transposase n=1 Tax=Gemmobacter sp. TaxID=1898957 RepID=UPI002AFE2BBA|nr:transposase [Gemmobacter sp.]